jgi:hypothetical protein
MANAHRYGFRYMRSIGGADTPQIFTFPIATAYAPVTVFGAGTAVNLNIGDPVRLLEDGTVALVQIAQDVSGASADSDDYAWGIIAGFPRVFVGGAPRPGSFYASGTAYTGGISSDNAPLVAVIPVHNNIFEVDSSVALTTPTQAGAMALVGGVGAMTYTVLTTGTGQPKANPLLVVTGVVSGGTDQLPLQVVGLGKSAFACDFTSAFVPFQVMFQNQQLLPVPDATHFGADLE